MVSGCAVSLSYIIVLSIRFKARVDLNSENLFLQLSVGTVLPSQASLILLLKLYLHHEMGKQKSGHILIRESCSLFPQPRISHTQHISVIVCSEKKAALIALSVKHAHSHSFTVLDGRQGRILRDQGHVPRSQEELIYFVNSNFLVASLGKSH